MTATALRIGLISTLAIGTIGGAAVASLIAPGLPESVTEDSDQYVTVTTRLFADERSVQIEPTISESVTLHSEIEGRVTATYCETGATLSTGSTVVEVDGHPVKILATGIPLWRDIHVGDSGSDVDSLLKELRSLGVDVQESGPISWTTAGKMRKWVADGDSSVEKNLKDIDSQLAIPASWIVWSAMDVIDVGRCHQAVGDHIGYGDPVLDSTQVVDGIRVTSASTILVDSPRTVTIDNVSVPLDPNLMVADVEAISALASTPSLKGWTENPTQQGGIVGRVSLTDPIEVASVPPSALVGLSTGSPCVITEDGSPVAVLVISSQLGLSLVTFSSNEPIPARVLVDPDGTQTCD